jgi:hypothetical protein
MTENERFGLVFVKTGSINSGTVDLSPYRQCREFSLPTVGGVANPPYQRYAESSTTWIWRLRSGGGGGRTTDRKSIFDYEYLPEFESKIKKATAIV